MMQTAFPDAMSLNIEEAASILGIPDDLMGAFVDEALCRLKASPTANAMHPVDAERIDEVRRAVRIGGDVRSLGDLADSCDLPHE